MKHTAAEYVNTDPFFGEESELSCRSVTLRTARKEHTCFGLGGDQHTIKPGETYRYEKARVDGSFWGEYRMCLSCMDKFIGYGDDED